MSDVVVGGSQSVACHRCGTAYGRRKGFFPVSYGILYKGLGYLPYCRQCVDEMFDRYYAECGDQKKAVRQMCRKLDIYWSEGSYELAEKTSATKSLMTSYLARVGTAKNAGKSYDDTLREEGVLWKSVERPMFGVYVAQEAPSEPKVEEAPQESEEPVPDEVRDFWGPGYTPEMYRELEQRRAYYMAKFPEGYEPDIGTEVIIRQICNLEIEINKGRTTGGNIAQSVKVLNELLGSANMKPIQKKAGELDAELERTPMGVWIQRWEEKRPVPEPDPEFQDHDGIIRYISVWFLGHLSKMLGIKNAYSKLYEREIDRLRVDRPEYADEDDEELFDSVFGGDSS